MRPHSPTVGIVELVLGLVGLVVGVAVEVASRPVVPISYRPQLLFFAFGFGFVAAYGRTRLPERLGFLPFLLNAVIFVAVLAWTAEANLSPIVAIWYLGAYSVARGVIELAHAFRD